MADTEIEVTRIREPSARYGTAAIATLTIALALFLGFVVWSVKQVAPNQREAQTQTEPTTHPRM
jgi:predicted negative regulator of RcsB-dependent stress response